MTDRTDQQPPIAITSHGAESRTADYDLNSLIAIAPGPSTVLLSSAPFSWSGVLVETHDTRPGQRPSTISDRHVISMLTGPSARFDHPTASGQFASSIYQRGSLTFAPAGPVPEVQLHTHTELLHCGLEAEFTREVVEAVDQRPAAHPHFQIGVRHSGIQFMLELLLKELESNNASGRLYVDSLVYVLTMQYVTAGLTSAPSGQPRVSALPPRILRRVQEKIEANLEADLSLEALAEESGYSRAHFLRMFQAATGLTPHQYVVDLRLRRAQERLRQQNASIVEVALLCGFSSQSHMTSVFRQRLNVTPASFRRDVRAGVPA